MADRDTPRFDADIFSDALLADPYPLYREMRDAGPVVRLDRANAYGCARYAEVREVLANSEVFISGEGVGFNDAANQAFKGSILTSDLPGHAPLRQALAEPMSVRRLAQLREFAQARADAMIAELKARGRFDGVADLARVFPVAIVGEFIGIPEEGREHLIGWGDANFNVIGGDNVRVQQAWPMFGACFEYMSWLNADPQTRLREGSAGRALYEAADRGIIPRELCIYLLGSLLFAGIDTTIASLANAIDLMGRHPDQWQKLRATPTRAPQAFNEVLRFASPVLHFKRVAARDTEIAGVPIERGANVAVFFASANRDERKYERPDAFDIDRMIAADHLAFGHGLHMCVGASLARLEANALLTAMAQQVGSIEIHGSSQHLNNTIRGLESLDVTFH